MFEEGGWWKKLYTCNYGPAGNIIFSEMYRRGNPCSACPQGTTCSVTYPGLCEIPNSSGGSTSSVAPIIPTTPATTTTTTTTTTPRPRTRRPVTTRRPTTTRPRTRPPFILQTTNGNSDGNQNEIIPIFPVGPNINDNTIIRTISTNGFDIMNLINFLRNRRKLINSQPQLINTQSQQTKFNTRMFSNLPAFNDAVSFIPGSRSRALFSDSDSNPRINRLTSGDALDTTTPSPTTSPSVKATAITEKVSITESFVEPTTFHPDIRFSQRATIEPTTDVSPTESFTEPLNDFDISGGKSFAQNPTVTEVDNNLDIDDMMDSIDKGLFDDILTEMDDDLSIDDMMTFINKLNNNFLNDISKQTVTATTTTTVATTPLPSSTTTPLPSSTTTPLPFSTTTPLPLSTTTPLPSSTTTTMPFMEMIMDQITKKDVVNLINFLNTQFPKVPKSHAPKYPLSINLENAAHESQTPSPNFNTPAVPLSSVLKNAASEKQNPLPESHIPNVPLSVILQNVASEKQNPLPKSLTPNNPLPHPLEQQAFDATTPSIPFSSLSETEFEKPTMNIPVGEIDMMTIINNLNTNFMNSIAGTNETITSTTTTQLPILNINSTDETLSETDMVNLLKFLNKNFLNNDLSIPTPTEPKDPLSITLKETKDILQNQTSTDSFPLNEITKSTSKQSNIGDIDFKNVDMQTLINILNRNLLNNTSVGRSISPTNPLSISLQDTVHKNTFTTPSTTSSITTTTSSTTTTTSASTSPPTEVPAGGNFITNNQIARRTSPRTGTRPTFATQAPTFAPARAPTFRPVQVPSSFIPFNPEFEFEAPEFEAGEFNPGFNFIPMSGPEPRPTDLLPFLQRAGLNTQVIRTNSLTNVRSIIESLGANMRPIVLFRSGTGQLTELDAQTLRPLSRFTRSTTTKAAHTKSKKVSPDVLLTCDMEFSPCDVTPVGGNWTVGQTESEGRFAEVSLGQGEGAQMVFQKLVNAPTDGAVCVLLTHRRNINQQSSANSTLPELQVGIMPIGHGEKAIRQSIGGAPGMWEMSRKTFKSIKKPFLLMVTMGPTDVPSSVALDALQVTDGSCCMDGTC